MEAGADDDEPNAKNADTRHQEAVSMEQLEAMVTPEQVLSASVAKKRRTITRKRSGSKNRSRTPMRLGGQAATLSSSDETEAKVPERPIRKVTRTVSSKLVGPENGEVNGVRDGDEKAVLGEQVSNETIEKHVEEDESKPEKPPPQSEPVVLDEKPPDQLTKAPEDPPTPTERKPRVLKRIKPKQRSQSEIKPKLADDSNELNQTERNLERASSIPRQLEEQLSRLDNFVNTNKKEIFNLFEKAKSSVEEKGKELRRRRLVKSDQKRSQSTPKQLTESDVLESFRRAQKATAEREREREIRSSSVGKYSTESEISEPERPARKPYRPIVQEFVNQKRNESQKQLKPKIKSNKIIEILDPKTAKIVATKEVGDVAKITFLDCLRIFRFHSPKQILLEYRKYKRDVHLECVKIQNLRRKCLAHFLILIIFCGVGGLIFKFTEGTFENFYKCGVKRVKRDFIDALWIRSHNLREEEWKSLARNKLRIFEEELHTAHEAGLNSYSGQRSWSFLNGIVYCFTVVTTIGYGHIYPTTITGQALTIVYSLIGIPLFLIILTDFGKLFTRCIKFVWSFVRRLYYTGSCRSVRKTAHVKEIFKGAQMMYEIATLRRPSMNAPNQSPDTEGTGSVTAPPTPAISNFEIDDEFNLPISVAILLLVGYIFLGAVIFQIFEHWDFFGSFYFVFISMTTIGFGDYVPRHPLFKIGSIVYIVFGLALMSMCINVVQVKLSNTFSQASAKIGATIGLTVVPEDGGILTVPPALIEIPPVHTGTPNSDIQVDNSVPSKKSAC